MPPNRHSSVLSLKNGQIKKKGGVDKRIKIKKHFVKNTGFPSILLNNAREREERRGFKPTPVTPDSLKKEFLPLATPNTRRQNTRKKKPSFTKSIKRGEQEV